MPTPPRLELAYHEAGHATVAALTGWRFRYVTLTSRTPGTAGHVLGRANSRLWLTGNWMPELLMGAAGMIAEDRVTGRDPTGAAPADPHAHRRRIVRVGRTDLTQLRKLAILTLNLARDRPAWPKQPIPPAGTLTALVEHVWAAADRMVTDHWAEIHAVAGALRDTPTLSQQDVADLVAAAPPAPAPPGDSMFWPAAYSRLRWAYPRSASAAEAV